LAFIATVTLIHEEPRTAAAIKARKAEGGWRAIPDKRPIVAMLLTNVLLMAANMTLEPIITIYVRELEPVGSQITVIAGLVMSASALGIVLSAPRLGKLADRIGHWPVINACLAISALLLIPQAFVAQGWQLIVLRFLMGLSLGGLSPCIASVIRHNVPESIVGTILGYSTSAQFVGLVVGPILGGVVGAHLGLSAVFIATAGLLGIGALYNQYVRLTMRRRG
jgi:MFS family permease